jgi:hypothetical protein
MSSPTSSTPLDALAEALANRVAQIVLDGLRQGDLAGWVDQSKSPLGRRRHIALARKEGRQVGRRYFLTITTIERALADKSVLAGIRVAGFQRKHELDVDSAMGAAPGK